MQPVSKMTLHVSTRHKNYSKLTKKQHIGRELELWGVITLLDVTLKGARKKIRTLRREVDDLMLVLKLNQNKLKFKKGYFSTKASSRARKGH